MKRIDRLALKFDEAYLAGEVDQFELPPYGSSFAAGYRQALEDAAELAEQENTRKLDGNASLVQTWKRCALKIATAVRALADQEEP